MGIRRPYKGNKMRLTGNALARKRRSDAKCHRNRSFSSSGSSSSSKPKCDIVCKIFKSLFS